MRAASDGRVVIFGATGGIGGSLARGLAAKGYRLLCAGRDEAQLADLARSVGDSGGDCSTVRVDVRDEDQVSRAFALAGPSLRGVVNCAGVLSGIGRIDTVPHSVMRDLVDVNLVGSMVVTKHAVAKFAESSGGGIVLLTGGGAGEGLPNYSVYAASKLAIARFVECVAVETADIGVRINALAPGMIPTKIHQATLAAGPGIAGAAYYGRTVTALEAQQGSDALLGNVSAAVELLLSAGDGLPTGRFFAAQYDPADLLRAIRLGPDDLRLRRTQGQAS